MRSVSILRAAVLAAAFATLAAPVGSANAQVFDPPEKRIQPPVGVASEHRIQPPVGVTTQGRIQVPVGVTSEKRIAPPVGVDQNYFEQLMLWLRAQIRLIE